MIPPGGFSLNDFFVTAQFAIGVCNNIVASRSAPRHFAEFRDQIGQFGEGLQSLHEVLKDHERHLFISGVRGTVDNNVQRSLSEVVGDFKGLQKLTEDFLKHYKFMVEHKRGSRNWAWKKVKVYGQGSEMFREMESIRKLYMFQSAKVKIVLEPLKFQLLHRVDTTLGDIQSTVNRIEQMARTLCNQTFGEIIQGQPQATAELPGSRLRRRSTSSLTLARQDTSLSDTPPIRQLQRQTTQLSAVGADGEPGRTNMNPRDSEWVFLDSKFEAALSKSVGLEHTKLNDVLDLIVRWLEEGRKATKAPFEGRDWMVNILAFVNLCKASWLCGKLLYSRHFEVLGSTTISLWHHYIAKLAEDIRDEFGRVTASELKTPRIRDLQRLQDQDYDLGLALLSIGNPMSGYNMFHYDLGREILNLKLPGYDGQEREVTLFEVGDGSGDIIRIKDQINNIVTHTTIRRSKTTMHPTAPFMESPAVNQPNIILNNSDDCVSLGFEFTDYKQLGVFQTALTGFKTISQIKHAGQAICYYHAPWTYLAKQDTYEKTSVQIWHEQRYQNARRQRQFSIATTSSNGRSDDSAQSNSTGSSPRSSMRGMRAVSIYEAQIAQRPESSKLVIFAKTCSTPSRVDLGPSGLEILVMDIEPYTMISRQHCCAEQRPNSKESKLCCYDVWIQKVPGTRNKYLQLLSFREPGGDQRRGDNSAIGGTLGPGLPLNPACWSNNPGSSYKSQKVDGLRISFSNEKDKRHFMRDFEDICILASKAIRTQTYE